MSCPLGAHPVDNGIQFAVHARDAAKIELCLFEQVHEIRLPLNRQGDIHSVTVPGITAGQRYGFRAHGDWLPAQGRFFDATKLLVDPYAKVLDGSFRYHPDLCEYGSDTAAWVPKAAVAPASDPMPQQPPIFRPGGMIYELNVRGFSRRHPEVSQDQRGTIAALAHPAIISHFRKLRVSAIELMPIVAWIDERHLPPLGLHNAWGYNPVVPMALDPRLAPGGLGELRATVAALREAGIGVILDLVLNHTGESDIAGPILSLRGLDNRCYSHAADGSLINDTGTGNTLNAADPAVHALILETLRHFASCGVDGFRFDLATVLARDPAFDPRAPIFDAIVQDPLLKDRVLIAEPWDVGPGGYQLGKFPNHWLEWNDRYRDDIRRFWRGDHHTAGPLATRMMGSSDIFAGRTTRSINFIAAHDGFTLADLVSYNEKHNDGNGEQNKDGQSENFSWNNGVEGPSDDKRVTDLRRADVRALLSTLFASRGTMMLCAGDEFGRTQEGNNNAYAQDNEVTWLNWADRDAGLEDFVADLATMRTNDLSVEAVNFLRDAKWFDLLGNTMTTEKWEEATLEGFEVQIPAGPDSSLLMRVDRQERKCAWRKVWNLLMRGSSWDFDATRR
jgi:glycogen operon protein